MALLTENPYDFSNPVTDPELLAGRGEVLREAAYYLELAKAQQQPTNLAILGERAAGKTSVLNSIASVATNRGLVSVRFDLDSTDVTTPLIFFHRFFDEVLTSAFAHGIFGGLGGPIEQEYTRLSYGSDPALPPSDFPFRFPIQWAIAAKQRTLDLPVSTGTLISDLQIVADAVGNPILVLIDEADLLSVDASILQKLRNVLMRLRHYVVVLAGTDDLFPTLDRIFSPIARQFKTLSIGPFDDPTDTTECIEGPLRKAGLDPARVIEPETYSRLAEIHDMARGRPYEVKLLCHFMFRRVQEGITKRMSLDLGVLEEVRNQLEKERNVSVRPVLTAVRSLEDEALNALSILVNSDRIATLKEKWQLEYIFFGSARYSEVTLSDWASSFHSLGILTGDKSNPIFAGDDFDRLYVTYLARERGVPLSFPPLDVPTNVFWSATLRWWFEGHEALRIGPSRLAEKRLDIDQLGLINILNAMSGLSDSTGILDRNMRLIVDLHNLMAQMQGRDSVPVWNIRFRFGAIDVSSVYTGPGVTEEAPREKLLADLNLVQVRVRELGGVLEVEEFQLPVYDLGAIRRTISHHGSAELKRELSRVHAGMARSFYQNRENCSDAVQHADLAFDYGADVWPFMANDMGYIFLAGGEVMKSIAVLRRAIQGSDGDQATEALLNYNLAIAVAHRGAFDEAIELLNRSRDGAKALDEQDRQMLCLIVGSTVDGRLRFDEVRNPDLLVAIGSSASAIRTAADQAFGSGNPPA